MKTLHEKENGDAKEIIEIFVKHIKFHDNGCFGCERHNKDGMLTITTDSGQIIDIFFTTEQLEILQSQINDVLIWNKL